MLPNLGTFTVASSSDTIRVMGRAGKALRHALEAHDISQNRLAITLGIDRSKVFRWFHEKTDPTAETVADIVKALNAIDSTAAESFIKLYLGDLLRDREGE
ncbi:helix-turn-helix domain-containing protein [Lusitaniella coriacea]|nr:helix-turn-helix transcriptional regulator [Lusitaniella coriacea]